MLLELLRGASSPELNKGLGSGKVSMGIDALAESQRIIGVS